MPHSTRKNQAFNRPVRTRQHRIAKQTQQRDKSIWLRSGDRYCARCRSLNFEQLSSTTGRTTKLPRGLFETIYPLGTVTRAMAQSTCPLCRVFARHFPGTRDSTQQQCVLRKLSSVKYYFPYSGTKKIMQDTVLLFITPAHVVRWRPSLIHKGGLIHLTSNPSSAQDQTIHFNPINRSQIDYGLLRKWIDYCERHHRGYCKYQLSNNVQSLPGFKLIDCKTRRLVKISTKEEYVALSYVWGNNPDRGSLSGQAPRVIEDAILVTRRLGYRYLWIDRYCIDQKNEEEKLAQVTKMDQIYASAVVTVAAVAGEGPEYGLPGVSQTLRCIQSVAVNGNYNVASSLKSPRDNVLSSKWATRGWTFQEAKLSRRVLFFTDEQMLYECASMSCQESLHIPMEALHQERSHSMGRESDMLRVFAPNGPGRFSTDIIEVVTEYTSRNLGWPSDNLNAISGIFSSFMRRWSEDRKFRATKSQEKLQNPGIAPVHHLWGIPILANAELFCRGSIDFLCLMLSWRGMTPSTRSPDFPSWSWTGWTLPSRVKFPLDFGKGGKGKWYNLCYYSMAKIWLSVQPGSRFKFKGLDNNSEYGTILRDASKILILSGPVVTVSFDRVMDKEYPLQPMIHGYCDNKSVRFWPNTKLDTEDGLNHFTRRDWRAILISACDARGAESRLLVLQRVGRMWERVGLLEIRNIVWESFFRMGSLKRLKIQ